jgi:hypothetical protein
MVMPDPVILIANGDLRLAANQKCWPAQARAEEAVMGAIRSLGRAVERGHACDTAKGHGFIDSQKRGMEVFRGIPPEAPLVVVEAVWQYSHHILHGLYSHRGPILTVANWSGEWPGLVGHAEPERLLTKAGVAYTLWSADFADEFFLSGLRRWLAGEPVVHDTSHVRPLSACDLPPRARSRPASAWPPNCGATRPSWAFSTKAAWACTTPSFPTNCCMPTGVFKERLSQSALYAAMRATSDGEARAGARLAGSQGHALPPVPIPKPS